MTSWKAARKMAKKKYRPSHIVVPAEEANKPITADSTTGLRAPCQWCKASIPIELIPLPPRQQTEATSFKLEDLTHHARQLAKRNLTHTLRGWCSICKVYGFDVQADLGDPARSRGMGVTVG